MDTAPGDIYMQSRAMASTRVGDSYTSGMQMPVPTGTCREMQFLTDCVAEARASRRFPRSTSDGELSLPRPDPAPLTKGMIEPQSSSQNRRRQSTRDQKTSQGLGSIQNSPSKRYASKLSRSFLSFIGTYYLMQQLTKVFCHQSLKLIRFPAALRTKLVQRFTFKTNINQ